MKLWKWHLITSARYDRLARLETQAVEKARKAKAKRAKAPISPPAT